MKRRFFISRELVPDGWFGEVPKIQQLQVERQISLDLLPRAFPLHTRFRAVYVADYTVAGITQREIVLKASGRDAVVVFVGNVGGGAPIQVMAEVEGMPRVWRRVALDNGGDDNPRPAKRIWWSSLAKL